MGSKHAHPLIHQQGKQTAGPKEITGSTPSTRAPLLGSRKSWAPRASNTITLQGAEGSSPTLQHSGTGPHPVPRERARPQSTLLGGAIEDEEEDAKTFTWGATSKNYQLAQYQVVFRFIQFLEFA
jgi:hypothetical protein